MKVSFYGGAQEVTGSCFLFETDEVRILIDCGLFQCPHFCDLRNHEPFPFDPKSIDAVFVTHSHIDHVGRIPRLVKEGFKGVIYSTEPTRDLALLMLEDSLGVMSKQKRKTQEEDLYSLDDITATANLWRGLGYGSPVNIGNTTLYLRNSGHILGSSMVEILVSGKRIVVTGDLGNPLVPLLLDADKVTDASILFIESVYGDRVHESYAEAKLKLERMIEDVVASRGVLMIPAFSLERTQELLADIHALIQHKRIPALPIFLDSPLAIRATEVYKKYSSWLDPESVGLLASTKQIFSFPELRMTLATEESKSINDVPSPKIIIAGSGMSTGGRIIHHERRYLPDPKNAILLIGFQAAGSLGRRIQDGNKEVEIFGEKVQVRARVETLSGYSAHADRDMLFDFVSHSRDSLEKVFVVQGETASSLFLVQRIRDYLGVNALAPRFNDHFEL